MVVRKCIVGLRAGLWTRRCPRRVARTRGGRPCDPFRTSLLKTGWPAYPLASPAAKCRCCYWRSSRQPPAHFKNVFLLPRSFLFPLRFSPLCSLFSVISFLSHCLTRTYTRTLQSLWLRRYKRVVDPILSRYEEILWYSIYRRVIHTHTGCPRNRYISEFLRTKMELNQTIKSYIVLQFLYYSRNT